MKDHTKLKTWSTKRQIRRLCEFHCFCSNVVEVSIPLTCDAVPDPRRMASSLTGYFTSWKNCFFSDKTWNIWGSLHALQNTHMVTLRFLLKHRPTWTWTVYYNQYFNHVTYIARTRWKSCSWTHIRNFFHINYFPNAGGHFHQPNAWLIYLPKNTPNFTKCQLTICTFYNVTRLSFCFPLHYFFFTTLFTTRPISRFGWIIQRVLFPFTWGSFFLYIPCQNYKHIKKLQHLAIFHQTKWIKPLTFTAQLDYFHTLLRVQEGGMYWKKTQHIYFTNILRTTSIIWWSWIHLVHNKISCNSIQHGAHFSTSIIRYYHFAVTYT